MDCEQIPGIPAGTKLVAVRTPLMTDRYTVSSDGHPQVILSWFAPSYAMPIIEADNRYGVIDIREVPVPASWERAGSEIAEWYREPQEGEYYVSLLSPIPVRVVGKDGEYGPCVIIRRIVKKHRVLVCEYVISEDVPQYDIRNGVLYFSAAQALKLTLTHPSQARIEEREA